VATLAVGTAGREFPYSDLLGYALAAAVFGPSTSGGPAGSGHRGGMSLCLAAGALVVALGGDEITLRWRHSVQKTLWEEVWRDTPGGLRLIEARVEGSGAGMDPPDGAS
jgi:hypothetical protein